MSRGARRERIDLPRFTALTRQAAGLPVSLAWRGSGSAVFLELGALTQQPGQRHARGEWTVMIEWSWRVERPRSIHFGSWSTERRITGGVARLAGERVAGIAVEGRIPELSIAFASGRVLRTFMTAEGQPAWTVFLPGGSWITVERGRMVHETSNAAPGAGVGP
jgi:hypothetical protein